MNKNREHDIWKSLDRLGDNLSINDLAPIADDLAQLGVDSDLEELVKVCKSRAFVNRKPNADFVTGFVAKLLSARESLMALAPNAGDGWLGRQRCAFSHAFSSSAESPLGAGNAIWQPCRMRSR